MDYLIEYIKERRQRILDGKINCIPLKFKRLRNRFPGLEKRRYIVYTANQKIGKSKLVDNICVYDSFFYSIENPDKLRLKIIYFTLEMGAKEKLLEFYSHLLYKLDNIRIDTTTLKSTNSNNPLPQNIIDLLESEKYQKYIKAFKECVIYIDDIKNPTGINKYCREFALNRGHLNFIEEDWNDHGNTKRVKRIDPLNPYTPNDEEEVLMIILDNYSNLSLESNNSKMQNIEKMSKYFITLRDQFNYCINVIQHQAQAQEGIENIKLNKIKPSSDGLADCKTTTRDVNMVIGLYSPFKYGLREYEGYDITKFKNNIRFMEIIEDRDYGANGTITPLFFDGAVSEFKELPLVNDTNSMQKVYEYLLNIRESKPSKLFFIKTLKHLKIIK